MASAAEEKILEQRAELIRRFLANPWIAHSYLFSHRHEQESSPAHKECVLGIWSPAPRRNIEAFRGFGKSTLLEETLILRAAMRMHRNILIVGASETRAIERLAAIKNEILTNEKLEATFGSLKGEPWQETKIVLSNGTCIQALGRDQSILGLKHLDWRPDAVLIDDVEPADESRSEIEKVKTWTWFTRALIPSLDSPVFSWIRVLGTRRGDGSLSEKLDVAGWESAKFPIETVAEDGSRLATWPAKFGLDRIDELRRLYQGDMHAFDQEFMCRAYSDAARVFHREELRFEPIERSWHAIYIMYDPARTKTQTSATTGKAVWSWVGNRLVVWECGGHFWSPDELIQDIIESARHYQPVMIAVEKTGLNEWLMQPLRHEMMKAGILLPLQGVEAPRGKLDFIRALQPLISSGELILAGDREQFKTFADQLTSFPRGRIDAPNALAYARLLRSGQPVHDNFGERHIAVAARVLDDCPLYVAAGADGELVTAVLLQRQGGGTVVLADFVAEGTPGALLGQLAAEIALSHEGTGGSVTERFHRGSALFKLPSYVAETRRLEPTWVIPPQHFNQWQNHGLRQAIAALPARCTMGGAPEVGRAALADELDRTHHGEPAFKIAPAATWCLRGLSGGYAYPVGGRGLAAAKPEAGIYKTLIEGLESFVAIGWGTSRDEGGERTRNLSPQPIAYTRSGMAYKSAVPERPQRR